MKNMNGAKLNELKVKIQNHLLDRVISGLSGRDNQDIIGSPSRNIYAGVLKPQYLRSKKTNFNQDYQQSSSIGLDFRVKPDAMNTFSIKLEANWAFYYSIFPDWKSTLKENQTLKKDDSSNDYTEMILPVTFRRHEAKISLDSIPITSNSPSEYSFDLKEDIDKAKQTIEEDQDRWCHLADPKKHERSLRKTENIKTEKDFIKELSNLKAQRPKQSLPDWKLSIFVEIRDDLTEPNMKRVRVLLVNKTIAFTDDDRDRGLDETSIFDTGLKIHINNGTVVPFEFLLAQKDYRKTPLMIAKGINCTVLRNTSHKILTTETLPKFKQPFYRTKADSGIKFEEFDSNNPWALLEHLYESMNDYSSEWKTYLENEGKNELSQNEYKECDLDRNKFIEESTNFKLGIECLRKSQQLGKSFSLMNRVFHRLGQKSGGKIVEWRLFQICFIVSQLPSLFWRENNSSKTSDFDKAVYNSFNKASILWFPTGGGKTEAYLGLVATSLIFDRLRGKKSGLNTWMRFPLRMLSLQQMERLMRVIAELNILKEENNELLNGDPFTVGYYVGATVTPNKIDQSDMNFYENNEKNKKKILILRRCPYCSSKVTIECKRSTWQIVHKCSNEECFSNNSKSMGILKGSLPLYIVDNEIYRFIPSVLVGTVDKLAIVGHNLGFTHLLSGASQKCADHGYAQYDKCMVLYETNCKNSKKTKLDTTQVHKDPGPSLLIQDELHLLNAELGVFNSHYEGLLQYICSNNYLPPKILAATATIESYERHALHLYLKEANRFPQPSWKIGESFYATSLPKTSRRTYLGILCHSKSIDDAASRVLLLYLSEIRRMKSNIDLVKSILDDDSLDEEVINNLLAVYDFCLAYVNRKITGSTLLDKVSRANKDFSYNNIPNIETDLLTGDRLQDDIGATFDRIEQERTRYNYPKLDVVAATSLISHGVDLERINMMVMCGMPSHYAEYVQSSSRSARSHPGFVFTCFLSKDSRELSQYEMFLPMHENIDSLIESVAINRFASFAPEKTVPGLLSSLLLNYYSPRLYESKDIAKPLNHIPTLKVALGFQSKGSSGTKIGCLKADDINKAIKNIIGVSHSLKGISQKEVDNIKNRIDNKFSDCLSLIGRTSEKYLTDVLKPLTSFRDVDPGLDFGSLDSSSVVTRLSGR